jgi:hypothetical protein
MACRGAEKARIEMDVPTGPHLNGTNLSHSPNCSVNFVVNYTETNYPVNFVVN